jgi:hypothetical protein
MLGDGQATSKADRYDASTVCTCSADMNLHRAGTITVVWLLETVRTVEPTLGPDAGVTVEATAASKKRKLVALCENC